MRVLVVEDDANLREGMVELVAEQAEVREAGSVEQALEALGQEHFTLVMTDLRIGQTGEGGRIILEAARKRLQPVAIVSASSTEDVMRVLRPHEPDAALLKPFQIDEMIGLVERFVRLQRDVERVAAGGVPAEDRWTEVASGLRLCESPGGSQWWRLEPGTTSAPALFRRRAGLMLLEGSLEVDGERRVAPRYVYLAAGPREVRTPEGCLAVSLPLPT